MKINSKYVLFSMASLSLLSAVFFFIPKCSFAAVQNNISTPSISVYPDNYYPLEEILYIEGKATPDSTVELRFEKQGVKPEVKILNANERGEWAFAQQVSLKSGDWEVRARSTNTASAITSDWSNPVVFKVILNGLSMGGVNIKFAYLSFIIVVLLVIGIALLLYFRAKVNKLKLDLVTKEVHEAENEIHEGFSGLKQNILEELDALKSKQMLSAEDVIRKERLLRDLDILERGMQKEVKDIEDKLH